MVGFLGGVRDQAGRRAFVPVAGRLVVAVDLSGGTVLWRKERIGRLVAATEHRLVTLDREGPACRLRLFGAADGSDVAVLDAPGIPAWTAQAELAAAVGDVKFHPTDPTKVVAGSLSGGAAWCSTDGGATWTLSTHPGAWGGRVEVCYATAAPATVYASVDVNNGEIWRSLDGGKTFARRSTLNPDDDPGRLQPARTVHRAVHARSEQFEPHPRRW